MQHKEAQEELRQYRERLEELVEERTAELTSASEQLRAEMAERTRAQEALARERNLLRTLIDNLPDFIYVKDMESRFLAGNTAVARMMGVATPDDLLGKTDFDLYPHELAVGFQADEREVLESGQPLLNKEEPCVDPEGVTHRLLTTKVPLRDAQGNTVGLVGIGRDVTERVRAESQRDASLEALARERNLLRTLIDILPDHIYVKDMESRFLAGNAAVARIMGAATPDDLLGKTDFDFFPHELAAEFHTDEREVLKSGQPLVNKEEPCVDSEGVTRRILTTKVPLRDAQGNTVGLVGIGRDVTERVRAEEALRASEERFAVAFRANPNAVAISHLETGRWVDVNDSFVSMYGYDRDEAIDRTAIDLDIWEEPEQRGEFMRMLREQGVVRDFQFAFRPKSGLVGTARLSAGLIELGGEPFILVVTNDITEQIRLEERLRQAQRMEAVGQLTGGIAHDFNNLLTVILGFTHLMQSQLSPEDPLYKLTERILYSGERAASLTSQLLAFSRKQMIQPIVLDLSTVIPDMDQMLQRIIGEDVEMRTVLAPDLWPVKMDPAQVEQIIVNIAVNARHAMPRGGQLTIEVANAVLDEDAVADRPETEPGEYVQLAITDTGVGMSDEVVAQIFEPFFTTREVGQGTGLGLSTVYGIVKQNHGDIWVHSHVGQGTTFKIYIPRARQATPSPSDRDQAADLPRGTETVLVVEDDPNVQDLMASTLRMQGYTVLQAANAPEALRLADEHGGDLHLLLSDLVLPGMNGLELAGRLATTNPGIKVLLTSGYTRDVIERHGMPSHGIPFIEKPFSPSDMARKVRDVLDE
jgi:PAS domain S-box-containing protein